MKTPLYYQMSEYDCGTVTLLNAVNYLFPREVVPPDIIKAITTYSLDTYNTDGEIGKSGTSKAAMKFITQWLNHNGPIKGLPINGTYYAGKQVYLSESSAIIAAIKNGSVAILRLNYGGEHYALATKAAIAEQYLYLFDPYLDENLKYTDGIVLLDGFPYAYNRKVPFRFFNEENYSKVYALGKTEQREAIVFSVSSKDQALAT
ncbi:hypothetical protein NIE88_01870 [Sporolactobacillus shoreicorticis]|uniref:Peptidase C39 n=1 Tax=Sporolactobacillus shoreicorticis TaxID=1923877 RepID=A0ABW5S2P4_9BACL|nr:hypothetical protein [Sporolactobacillus shoreicorticis]MCO7124526.1 hypothetical protein [Sporolactobacillus shoreicorticis]